MQKQKGFEKVEQYFEGGLKKRFACSHCGKTWVEIVGLFAVNTVDQEDMYLQLGSDSETCQNCRFKIKSCPSCGSKDAYEINFPLNNPENSPLTFDSIRIVSNT